MTRPGITGKDNLRIGQQFVSHDFFDMFGLQLLAGRTFSKNSKGDEGHRYLMRERFPAYDGRSFIINESAAKLIGKTPEKALGMPMHNI